MIDADTECFKWYLLQPKWNCCIFGMNFLMDNVMQLMCKLTMFGVVKWYNVSTFAVVLNSCLIIVH